jgi:hypothetical protein
MERTAGAVVGRCKELEKYWAARNNKMKTWYKLIQMLDELKTEKMESFVGNDPRSMYNLVLHLLDAPVIPHRLRDVDTESYEAAAAGAEISKFLDIAWEDVGQKFRHSGPRQSLKRSLIGLLISTGWYSVWACIGDDGQAAWVDLWNPAETFPLWDGDQGLSEVAHIYSCSPVKAKSLYRLLKPGEDMGRIIGDQVVYDYWWTEISSVFPYTVEIYNAVVVANNLLKFTSTRFKCIPVYVAPVGGLPDTGTILSDNQENTKDFAAGSLGHERWKEEIGQAVVATNENIYRSWNKWWTFSLQLLRDTAQPRIFERSRSGKAIVKPEDIFRRGAVYRGGPDDSVDFLVPPAMPLELRSTQLDLEAMMQRGGVSWALYGNVTGDITAYVMSQIAASANQVMRPYHQAMQDLIADIDNDWVQDVHDRSIRPYGWKYPSGLPANYRIIADYDIEIPGDLVQRATVGRMINPTFELSYSYTVRKLFPEIKDPNKEKAMVRADKASQDPRNALIAYIGYCRQQAIYLDKINDSDNADLYRLAAESALAQLSPPQAQALPTAPAETETEQSVRQIQPRPSKPPIGNRPEGLPPVTENMI